MAELRLSYNPYTAETQLWIGQRGSWMPVSRESSLMRVSGTRMQRWIYPSHEPNGACFFDELRATSGDDILEILFCGTSEDFGDLKQAAEEYMRLVPDVSIEVKESPNTRTNSSRQKLKQLDELVLAVQDSNYHVLLPEEVWSYLQRSTQQVSVTGQLIALADWQDNRERIFSPDAWKMTCLHFPFEQMSGKPFREYLRTFAEEFGRLPDRSFERERFLFLCVYDPDDGLSPSGRAADTKLVLLEKGVQDIPILFLEREEVPLLNQPGAGEESSRLSEVRAAVELYNRRYAEQYRMRKIHDVLQEMLAEHGFVAGAKLFRAVEARLRDRFDPVSDAQVDEAYRWVVQLLESLNHLLDVSL